MTPRVRRAVRRSAVVVGTMLLGASLTACSAEEQQPFASSVSPTAESPELAAAVAALPKRIRDAGALTIATDPVSPPGSYYGEGREVTGWEVELAQRVAERLGLGATVIPTPFGQILTDISMDEADLGVSSIFDTPERRNRVDMVDYFVGGTSWVGLTDSEISPEDACGTTVAVLEETFQAKVDLPRRSLVCTSSGKEPITVVKVSDLAPEVAELQLGNLDAIVGDSPAMDDLVQKGKGRLTKLGDTYDLYPYGIAIRKGDTAVVDAVRLALESIKADGSYDRLLAKWGVEDGAVSTFTVNGG